MSQLYTSSGKYSLDAVYFNKSILDWIDIIHSEVSNLYGMKKIKITPMDYGHDSYACVLTAILSHITTADIMGSIRNGPDFYKFVEYAHTAWTENYLFWKSKYPDQLSDNPKKTINTINRNDRATTHATNLSATDFEMYKDIIQIIFDKLTHAIFEAGMQNLSVS